jgi:hypothetical protein
MTPRLELAMLLQERTLSNWERRKRRLERIPLSVVTEALRKARKGEPLTLEEYIASHLGFLPGELESMRERDAAEQSERQVGRQGTAACGVFRRPGRRSDRAGRDHCEGSEAGSGADDPDAEASEPKAEP